MSIKFYGMVVLLVAAACAPLQPKLAPGVGYDVIASLLGAWDNQAQFKAAPPALKVPPSVQGEWLDQQYAEFHLVRVPALGDQVVYLEWRNGGPGGTISRQRLWSFRADPDGTLRMDFYAFIDGAPWDGKGSDSTAFANITAADLRAYAPECALRFTQEGDIWRARISAEECQIVAASGRKMGIDATVELSADGVLAYRESGVLENAQFAFRVPPTQPYEFRRINP